VYARLASHTGRGLARDIATGIIDVACACSALEAIEAAFDEPNFASCRVLEQLGFIRYGEARGAFGKMWLMRLNIKRMPATADS
jgi:RimJ/RimL family protein N-acetyltransferase